MRRVDDTQLQVTFKPLVLAVFGGITMRMNRAQRKLLSRATPADFLAYLTGELHKSSLMPKDLLERLDYLTEQASEAGEHIERSRIMYRMIVGDEIPTSEIERHGLLKPRDLLRNMRSTILNQSERLLTISAIVNGDPTGGAGFQRGSIESFVYQLVEENKALRRELELAKSNPKAPDNGDAPRESTDTTPSPEPAADADAVQAVAAAPVAPVDPALASVLRSLHTG